MSEEKTGIGKKILAVVVALITISVTITILRFIVPVVGALTLGLFDIHVSESEEALRNLEAFSNIFNLEGDINKANDVLRNFIDNIEENIEIINTVGINLLNAKKYEELEKHLNKFVNKFESHILFFLNGYLLTTNERITESEHYFIKSISILAPSTIE